MPQLARMASQSGEWGYLRCPYQAQVMKTFEPMSSSTVHMEPSFRGWRQRSNRPEPIRFGAGGSDTSEGYFFSRSRIWVSSCTSALGGGGGASSFLRLKRFTCFTMMKMAKATIKNLMTAFRNWP